MPVHLAARQVIERTRLRDRIISLGEERADMVDRELDELLAAIDRLGAEGATLPEIARELRDALGQVSPAGEEVRDEVQLYTWHKSKGLEWQTVIVPFVHRTFGEKSLKFPRVVLDAKGGETIYRDTDDYAHGAKEFAERRAWQQFQRLLYVTCTRPRHSLLLIDDEALLADARKVGPFSATSLLRVDQEPSRALWQSLPATLNPKPDETKISEPAQALIAPNPPLSADDMATAIARGRDIPRRVTPHALAVHPPPEAEPERTVERDEPAHDSLAILYGTWWHELMEIIPWQEPRDEWGKLFDKALLSSPQPERARREWDILLESKLARWLATPGLIIHRELPFLWPDGERCLEGVMDLAVFSPSESRWRVVDWEDEPHRRREPARDLPRTDRSLRGGVARAARCAGRGQSLSHGDGRLADARRA